MKPIITKTARIHKGTLYIDGKPVMEDTTLATYGDFIRAAYKFAEMSYPKFYKMDSPCKLALVATELILKGNPVLERHGKENIGLVIQNSSSTLDTDTEFQNTIDDRGNYFPSPAVFVYTLPNIMLGEICIRHKFFGENALLLEPAFDAPSLTRHVELLFQEEKVTACITGYVEQHGNEYDAFLYLAESGVSEEMGLCPHDALEITNIYQYSSK